MTDRPILSEAMRVLVCGGRDYHDTQRVHDTLDALHARHGISTIIQGGASGADRIARNWANSRGIATTEFRADWTNYGPSAGPRRNQQMIDDGHPDLVVAFPGGRGTADMMRRAKAADIRLWEVLSVPVTLPLPPAGDAP